jgi:hypothetical protein
MPQPFYPQERPSTNRMGGWVGPGVGLDRHRKSRPPLEFDPWIVQSVASHYTNIPEHTVPQTKSFHYQLQQQ